MGQPVTFAYEIDHIFPQFADAAMRDTYSTFGVLGVPVDDFEIDELIDRIDQAIVSNDKLLISTVNTNFLVNSSLNPGFRQSLLESDVCTVDGVGMLLMCRLAFVQQVGRVSGADLMQRLVQRSHTTIGRPLRVFFFGGNEAIADMARRAINRRPSAGICCVGSLNPGFGSMDDLSSPHLIKIINDARPDFLVVALGAERGQEWLLRNRAALNVPVASHLGAAVNFVAGVIERAPLGWQKVGLEWLWRIYQEPPLVRRYHRDAWILLRLLAREAVPNAAMGAWARLSRRFFAAAPQIEVTASGDDTIITLAGMAVACRERLAAAFAEASASRRPITLDCRKLSAIDAGGLGEVVQLRRALQLKGQRLAVRPSSRRMRRLEELASGVAVP